MSTIFVQIASYRDQQLVPTIRDCLATASDPDSLRFGICWQHDESETLGEFEHDPRFRIIDVPYGESRGVCWARHQTQLLFRDETYTLQLDSHHRFVTNWDRQLMEMLEAARSPKPILTAYAPHFDPSTDTRNRLIPGTIAFGGFDPNGPIYLVPAHIDDFEALGAPVPARFCAAGFLFTLGDFCRQVPYDPQFYFLGEEVSLSVRAFTHGYDLFHPHRALLWHFYGGDRRRHWDDHVPASGRQPFWELADESHRRLRLLFEIDEGDTDLGPFGLGTERSLQDYQEYAGIHFRLRAALPAARDNELPPTGMVPDSEAAWREHSEKTFSQRIRVGTGIVPAPDDLDFWRVSVHNRHGHEIFRQDLKPKMVREILAQDDPQFLVKYRGWERGSTWTVRPHGAGEVLPEQITGDC